MGTENRFPTASHHSCRWSLVAEGYSNHEIAEELSLAPHTVENYVSELMEMCCCRTRIRLAIHIGELHTLQETKESAP